MADFVFFFGCKFGKSAVVTVGQKNRIITEAIFAAGRCGDGSFDFTFKYFKNFSVESYCNCADKSCSAVFNAFKFFEQFFDSFRIARGVS